MISLQIDIPERIKKIHDRRVYATRYGRITLNECKQMPLHELHLFLNALFDIIQKESTVSSLNEKVLNTHGE